MNSIARPSLPLILLRLLDREPIRYLAASGVALAVDLGLFSLMMRSLQLSWPLAASIGFVSGALTAYLLSVLWVFTERSQRANPFRELALFVLIGAIGLLLTQATLWVGIQKLHAQPELARVAASGITFFFNYLTRALALFRERCPKSDSV